MRTFKDLGDKFLARFKRAHSSRKAYLSTLAGALYGLPPDLVANTLASYAHYFVEGADRGLNEQQVAASLPAPRQIAAQCRAELHGAAFAGHKSLPNLWRLLISLIGLCILNLFLTVPAIVFGALLFVFYCVALAFYVGGIALTAGAIAGVDEITLASPHRVEMVRNAGPARIDIDAGGVSIYGIDTGKETLDSHRISLSSALGDFSRGEQTTAGIGLIAGAILMLLAALMVTKYAAIGLKRYVLMNFALLRNA